MASSSRSFSSLYARVKSGESKLPPPYVPSHVCRKCGQKMEEGHVCVRAKVEDEFTTRVTCALPLVSLTMPQENEVSLQQEAVPSEENYFPPPPPPPHKKHDDDDKDETPRKEKKGGSRRGEEGEEEGKEDRQQEATPAATPAPEAQAPSKSFSLTTMELAEQELCLRLSNESRDIFEDDVGRTSKATTSIAGWQRYSASFGPGRMGIEFEWDGKATRRLVVTRVGQEAAALGVRSRDVLIGVGNRPIPRATDPIAVHKHLISCARPVTLHFYRLHVRRVEKPPPPPKEAKDDEKSGRTLEEEDHPEDAASSASTTARTKEPSSQEEDIPRRDVDVDENGVDENGETPRSRIAAIASAVWDRLPALSASQDDLEKANEATPALERAKAESWPPPSIIVDVERYRAEDDDDDDYAENKDEKDDDDDDDEESPPQQGGEERRDDHRWTCLLDAAARKSLANALKPVLRPKPWVLAYDSICDGMCLEALYNGANLAPKGPQILLVRDDKRNVAGAFVDEKIRNVGDYYGTGECFVFELRRRSRSKHHTPPPTLEEDDVRVHRWVGPGLHDVDESDDRDDFVPALPSIDNDMFVYASAEILGFGSGGGGFAIRIDEALEFGASRPCATYGNDASLFDGRDTFPVQRVQLWAFGAFY